MNVKGGSGCCLGELQGEWAAGECPWKGRGLCWVRVQLRGSRRVNMINLELPSKSTCALILLLLPPLSSFCLVWSCTLAPSARLLFLVAQEPYLCRCSFQWWEVEKDAWKDPCSWKILIPDTLDPNPKGLLLMCSFNTGWVCF